MADGLAPALGYRFQDIGLLRRALTHRSVDSDPSYERLEFLGDRVLGLLIASLLYKTFPKEPEGALARRHTALVRQETVAEVAQDIDLGAVLTLSKGEEDVGGRDNPALLCDVCEAVIGALYLDGGIEVADAFVLRYWRPLMDRDPAPPKDAKTSLQEWAQGRGLPLPLYRETGRSGPPHRPEFTIAVSVDGLPEASGTGSSKRAAEQEAARRCLEQIDP